VKIVRSSPLRLSALRLRKLEVVTIKINVLWADSTRPERSNIYFKNILYPLHGGTAPQIDNGTGEFTLPKGFEYDAVASVESDAGKLIEPRMSRPDQRIKVADGLTPAEMTLSSLDHHARFGSVIDEFRSSVASIRCRGCYRRQIRVRLSYHGN
jgi:hypothetical protein